jgi:hypothetical protein
VFCAVTQYVDDENVLTTDNEPGCVPGAMLVCLVRQPASSPCRANRLAVGNVRRRTTATVRHGVREAQPVDRQFVRSPRLASGNEALQCAACGLSILHLAPPFRVISIFIHGFFSQPACPSASPRLTHKPKASRASDPELPCLT